MRAKALEILMQNAIEGMSRSTDSRENALSKMGSPAALSAAADLTKWGPPAGLAAAADLTKWGPPAALSAAS